MSRILSRLGGGSHVHACVAFLAMGGWAAFANRQHMMPAPLVAMLLQGSVSASITLVLKRGIETLARRCSGAAALIVPPIVACIVSTVVLAVIHGIGSTPEPGRTIAVPLAVSTGYATLYSFALRRARKDRR